MNDAQGAITAHLKLAEGEPYALLLPKALAPFTPAAGSPQARQYLRQMEAVFTDG
jgi:hypothetical protein